MAKTNLNKASGFFWQGLLIILPVAVLTIAGLTTLRRDLLTTEREEQQRASQNLAILGKAVRSSAEENLEKYLIAQNMLMLELRQASQPAVRREFPDAPLKTALEAWDKKYPELKVESLAAPEGAISTEGRELNPPAYADAPIPPRWYLGLSPRQRELWRALRQAGERDSDKSTLAAAREAFLKETPDETAQSAARCVTGVPEAMIEDDDALPATETGLPFQDLACYRLLRGGNEAVLRSLPNGVWKRIVAYPSFAAPTLLRTAEELTNKAIPEVRGKVQWIAEYWNAQERARVWLEPIRALPELRTNWSARRNFSRWSGGASDAALAIFTPATLRDGAGDHEEYDVVFVPRPVLEAVFVQALAENAGLIPAYARASLSVQGLTFPSVVAGSPPATLPLMDSVKLPFGKGVIYEAADFGVSLYLADRKLMLITARNRIERFGLLLAGAVVVAMIGLVASRRAFLRQWRLNEMKSNFVSSVSHELRAPIASVRLMAEGLERGKITNPEKQAEYFRFIVQECRRLSGLIENVLDFSRIEQGRKQYVMESTDLAALAGQTAELMRTYAAEREIQITVETTGVFVPIEADGKAIQQALVNLIDNALKHSPRGSVIRVGVDFGAARTSLWVEDRGEGIPSHEHEKIFERFYRVGSELRRETQGVGIGLSIVKHIVEGHGGTVRVRSAPGQGSRFTIELPSGDAQKPN